MALQLDRADIQGNLLTAYGRIGFPTARCVLLHVTDGPQARGFLDELRAKITTAELWPSSKTRILSQEVITARRPDVAINVAFTFRGLLALEVPVRTLRGMPDEFQEGMLARASILQDDLQGRVNIREAWDPIWVAELNDPAAEVHILISLNVSALPISHPSPAAALEAEYQWLCDRAQGGHGIRLLAGHRGPSELYQEMAALMEPDPTGPEGVLRYSRKEHFGFTDGIGDPVFEGQHPQETMAQRVVGQGKLTPEQTWVPLATGEFLLGYPDEAQEIPGAAMPLDFSRNGTFLAYRKLHQNVVAFREYIAATAVSYAAVTGLTPEQADATLRAKMAGRWSDGVPLVVAPTYAAWEDFRQRMTAMAEEEINNHLVNFTYASDPDGAKCPFSAHLRRANPRDMLDPTPSASATPGAPPRGSSVLNNRRRLLRRGLPYGSCSDAATDQEEHGVLMLTVCASLFRQFEFVQQQWMQYGLDFNAGNDTCPLIGNHGPDAKFVIPSPPGSGLPPFLCDRPPQFVETRGGAYFFVPSMTALRLIAQGLTDPT
jgi:deferrochelatase/peroxidase EfeB